MKRKFDLKKDVIIALNPLQTRYQLFSERVFQPLYSATNDGIYRMERLKRTGIGLGLTLAELGVGVLIIFLGIFIYFTIYFTYQYIYIPPLAHYPLAPEIIVYAIPFAIPIGIFIGIIVALVFGIVKLVKIIRKLSRKINIAEGELVVPWVSVRNIVVTNVRQENIANRPSITLNIISPVYKEIGDWHVLTTDGRDITIPNVDDPFNKLNYVKNRFNLTF